MEVVAILLAAGGGSRYDGDSHKLHADLGGRPLYLHAVDAAVGSQVGPVLVVIGAVDLDLPQHVEAIRNPEWADGQAGSLRVAIAAARDRHRAEAVVVGLADQPFVPASAWSAIAAAPDGCAITVATYGGSRGPNPVRLLRSVWPLLPASGDEGARSLIRGNPQLVCEVPCIGSAADIDTLEDLRQWTSS